MIIKHNTAIVFRISTVTSMTRFKATQARNLALARVALEHDNIKLAIEALIDMGLRELDNGFNSDDLTKLLNTEFVKGDPDATIRDMLLDTVKPQTPAKPLLAQNVRPVDFYILAEIFPSLKEFNSFEAHVKESLPQHCQIKGAFEDRRYSVITEYFLVKRVNEDYAILSMIKCGGLYKAQLLHTGSESAKLFGEMKQTLNECLNKR